MNQYFIQAIGQLKQHPIISIITVVGTSLAIFLIMLVVMINQIKVMPFSPVSNRDRFLHISYLSLANKNWGDGGANGPMSIRSANELYKSLKTPEAVTAYLYSPIRMVVSIPGKSLLNVNMRETDAEYWKVFDHKFIAGKPYTKQDVESHIPQAVITETTAKKLFGDTDGIIGREILFNYLPCRISGVVKDVSILSDNAYAQVWVPYGTLTNNINDTWYCDIQGKYSVTILAKSRKDFPEIRKECEKMQRKYSDMVSADGFSIISRNRPYDQEKESAGAYANIEPDVNQTRTRQFTIYAILLLVPAINLASMTHSRLRQRVIEIGIRRVFGATRLNLFSQIVMENLIVTLLAGIIGYIMSMIFATTMASKIFIPRYNLSPDVDLTILFQPRIFAFALLFCFILNLLSCGFPAWRASISNIVNSLYGKE